MNRTYLLFIFFLFSIPAFSQNAWQRTNGPEGAIIKCLAVNTNNVLVAGTQRGVYKSIDNGETWQLSDSSDFYNFNSDAIGLNSKGRIYVATNGTSINTSNDDGLSWQKTTDFSAVSIFITRTDDVLTNNGYLITRIGDSLKTLPGFSFAISSPIDNSIWTFKGGNVRISTDNGRSWPKTFSCSFSSVTDFTLSSENLLFAGTSQKGIYKSLDSGKTWLETGMTNIPINAIAFLKNGHLLAATKQGIFRSTDNADSWEITSQNDPQITKILTAPNGVIYALSKSYQGIYRSTDNGYTWTKHSIGFRNSYCKILFSDSQNCIYVSRNNSILKSTNQGETWESFYTFSSLNTGTEYEYFSFINLTPSGKMFVGVSACDSSGLNISTDNGQTWKRNKDLVASTPIVETASGELLFGNNNGINSSKDNGNSWKRLMTQGVSGLSFFGDSIVAVSYGYNEIYIAAQDKTSNWKTIPTSGISSAKQLLINSQLYGYVLISNKIRRSKDRLKTWNDEMVGLPNGVAIRSILVSPDDYLYAATDKGIFRCDSKADNIFWTAVGNSTLINKDIASIVMTPDGKLFAGTNGGGVFKYINNSETLLAPEQVCPLNGSINQLYSVTLGWNEVSGAEKYTLQVAKRSDFADKYVIINDSAITATNYQLTDLEENTTYYWKVLAKTSKGITPWSHIWAFKTIDPTDVKESREKVEIYPNPAINSLAIKNCGGLRIEIINYLGIKCLAENISSDLQLIDIAALSPGIYYLVIQGNNKIKLIKY